MSDRYKKLSVVISTFDDPITFVNQCLNSLLFQEKIEEIIVIDSSKKDCIRDYIKKIEIKKDKIKYVHTPPKGLSDARNKGIDISKNDIVAFTDSDCIVDKNWADTVLQCFYNDKIAIVGGKIIPKWISKPNKILYKSSIAQGFYSAFDMGDKRKEVGQIFGGNFAINKKIISTQFMKDLGRTKDTLLGGEETELCNQVRNENKKIIYNPLTIVWHQIPKERTRFAWMWKRMYYGGINRSKVGGQPTPITVNTSYNIYDIIFLILFIVPYLYGFIHEISNRSANTICAMI